MPAAPHILVVGASLAGLRTAEAVLAALPGARVTLLGDEPHAPYNRPPLSKEVLTGIAQGAGADETFPKLALRSRLQGDAVSQHLDERALSVDVAAQELLTDRSRRIGFDWLVAATGLRPRRLPFPGGAARRHVLRGFDDAMWLGRAMQPGRRLVVAGGGFVGCEVAATAAKLGLKVTLLVSGKAPLSGPLGPDLAGAVMAMHRAHGVDLRCGLRVTGLEEWPDALCVHLSDGSTLMADELVEAVGSEANVDWLAGTCADLADGVLCDGTMTAKGVPRLMAAGDVARFPNPLFGGAVRRVEHWCVPGQTARRVAETIAARQSGQEPAPGFAPMPSFWTDQYGLKIQGFGAPALADEIIAVEGQPTDLGKAPVIMEYRRAGLPVGLVTAGAPPQAVARHRAALEAALTAAAARETENAQ